MTAPSPASPDPVDPPEPPTLDPALVTPVVASPDPATPAEPVPVPVPEQAAPAEPVPPPSAEPVAVRADRAAPEPAAPAVAPPAKRKRRWLRRTLIGLAVAILVIALTGTGLVVWSVRRAFPQLSGQLALPGLAATVTVYRDQYGIPQVYGDSMADLFRAQGYLHAQDRFWEMDFRRHITAGRLSEMFGASEVSTDAFLRTLGWHEVAQQEWDLLDAQTKSYLQAYADGVNAWIDQNGGSSASGKKSLEYSVLGLLNSSYTIEPWSPIEALAWLKAMAWDLRGNMSDEIGRAMLLANGLTREQIEALYPEYPYDENRPIVKDSDLDLAPPPVGAQPLSADVVAAAPALAGIAEQVAALPAMLGETDPGIGSNSWVVAGSHTTTGKPLLANDPHLAPSMPGIWYQLGLHCTCDFNVEGFSFSGVPGVIIGHNARIAWGFTNLGPDVTDLYLEKVDGDKVFDGEDWVPLSTRQEVIKVAGGSAVTITVRSSKHGPLLSDREQDLLTIAARPPVDASGSPVPSVAAAPTPSLDASAGGVPDAAARSPYAVALQWTALHPNTTIKALFALNQAGNWTQFRAAAAMFDVPAQNLVYADVDGNIGYQSPGRIPIRARGNDGTYPVPGWDPAYDWKGYIPFDRLPSVRNPSDGWIVTANQAVVGPAYPYLLTKDWDYGFRSQRIMDMLSQRLGSGKVDAEAIRQMQFDNRNGFAPRLIGALQGMRTSLSGVPSNILDLLFNWDYQQGEDSAAAALYNVFYRHLLSRTFDELPADQQPDAGSRWWVVFDTLLDQPTSPWWDDTRTPAVENMTTTVSGALVDAVNDLYGLQGRDPAKWRWGSLHTLTLTNATFGTSGIGPIEWLFNRGPGQTSGGDSIVNATSWDPNDGDYTVTWVPSMRMIVDLSNLDDSRWVQLTGNSGHAFHPNYDDQFPLWRVGDNLPMRWERTSIEAAAKNTLTLHP